MTEMMILRPALVFIGFIIALIICADLVDKLVDKACDMVNSFKKKEKK